MPAALHRTCHANNRGTRDYRPLARKAPSFTIWSSALRTVGTSRRTSRIGRYWTGKSPDSTTFAPRTARLRVSLTFRQPWRSSGKPGYARRDEINTAHVVVKAGEAGVISIFEQPLFGSAGHVQCFLVLA